jgi:Domain of Unknown Function with PDB structure (DUF3857)
MKCFFLLLIYLILNQIGFAQEYDAELIEHSSEITLKNNRLIQREYFEIKINNRDGEKYSTVKLPFSKLSKLTFKYAYLKDEKGNIIKKLDKRNIIERSSKSNMSYYEDEYIKEFTLNNNSFPYSIVYSFETRKKEFFHIDYWIPVIDIDIPTYNATLILDFPQNYKVNYSYKNIESINVDTLDENIIISCKSNYTNVLGKEEFAPPIRNFLPFVSIVPDSFNYENKGSFNDWQSFGKWQDELLSGLDDLPDFEKKKINNLVNKIDDESKKIKTLYYYLQDETRYLNIVIETGGLKPFPASYVATNKYGDCKALSNYFKSVLNYIDIEAYYVLVKARTKIDKIQVEFPSQQFNHVIIYIPLEQGDIWLDCTSNYAYNYLGTFTQDRNAFLIDGNKSRFVLTPKLSKEDVLVTRKIFSEYISDELTISQFENKYKGEMYEMIHGLFKNYNNRDKSWIINNYFLRNGSELIDYNFKSEHRDSNYIQLTYKVYSRNIYTSYGDNLLIENLKFDLSRIELPEKRNFPVQIDYPIYQIDTIIYTIPEGFSIYSDVNDSHIDSKYGSYSLDLFVKDSNILVVKKLLIKSGEYPTSEYNGFYLFYEKILKHENKSIATLTRNK